MRQVGLPILTLAVREQRYSCHGCGNCCRDFTVQLRAGDLAKLHAQKWEERLGEPVTIDFRGTTFLRQREDGACIFLMDDGRCRVHAEFGFTEKPLACQLFPFTILPGPAGLRMGVNFACQSVLENKGAALPTHQAELARLAAQLPELQSPQRLPWLTDRLRAEKGEVDALSSRIDAWLRRTELPLGLRLDGLAWVVASLGSAKLPNVRGQRFVELLDVLFGALPDELAHHPIESPTNGQLAMLRRAVFARTEDLKLSGIKAAGRIRTTFSQLLRQRRFAKGIGPAPRIAHGWPVDQPLETVDRIGPCADAAEAAAIDDLVTRYIRASALGGRCWGAGYYGWPVIRGLEAMLLNLAAIGWLARLHAAGRGLATLDIVAVRAALGRVDRAAGRAPWLGSAGERLRLTYLATDDGIRRLLAAYRFLAP